MKQTLLLLTSSWLLASTAQAQTTFSVGPRVGFNVSSIDISAPEGTSYTSCPGVEAGLTGTVQFGHFAVQPSLLFSQHGYRSSVEERNFDIRSFFEEDVRLNYLTLPVNLAWTPGRNGQGLQVLAGPYARLLVGGNFTRQDNPPNGIPVTGNVKTAKAAGYDPDNRYTQRVDGGLQAGVGYCLKGMQLQACYSMGLRDLAVPYRGYDGRVSASPAYYNRAFQVSFSYLVGVKG